jgi:hypothetical protein
MLSERGRLYFYKMAHSDGFELIRIFSRGVFDSPCDLNRRKDD